MDPILVLGALVFIVAAPFAIPAWHSMLTSDGENSASSQDSASGTLL